MIAKYRFQSRIDDMNGPTGWMEPPLTVRHPETNQSSVQMRKRCGPMRFWSSGSRKSEHCFAAKRNSAGRFAHPCTSLSTCWCRLCKGSWSVCLPTKSSERICTVKSGKAKKIYCEIQTCFSYVAGFI